MRIRPRNIRHAADWKGSMQDMLDHHGVSRYRFVRDVADAGIATVHTGECLLAADGTATGGRLPSLQVALDMARLAGYEVVLVPKRRPSRRLP